MAVFILSPEADSHADRCEWGLREAGVEVFRWRGLGGDWQHSASVCLNGDDSVFLDDRRVKPQDTVWLRGLSLQSYPEKEPEASALERSVLMAIERSGAFCINKFSAARMVENKTFQLSLAKQCGLRVPATIMSSCPEFLPDFSWHSDGDVVRKAFLTYEMRPGCQNGESAEAVGIYQQRIEKCSDVRVNMLNRDFHSFEVAAMKAERIALPVQIEGKLRRFAERADIAFGCFDMLVDPSGEWWFLGVSQAGQFLWIDDLRAEDGLFEPMLEFLSTREGCPNAVFPTYKQSVSACPEIGVAGGRCSGGMAHFFANC